MLFYEAMHSGGYDLFRCHESENLDFAAHFHRAFELIDVENGEIIVTVGQKEYAVAAGEALLVLPDEIHAYHTPRSSHCRMFIFSEDYAHGAYTVLKGKAFESPRFCIDERIRSYLMETLLREDAPRMHRKACLGLACAEALGQCAVVERDRAEEALLSKLITLVQSNFAQDITLREVARRLGYDYSYLSRYLNRVLHMSFAEFLNGCRMSLAASLLHDEMLKITEVARLCGYENVRTFNRNFLRVHRCTPREFRARTM